MNTRKLFLSVSLVIGFAALALVGVVGAATNGSTYTVRYTHDQIDSNPGDDICATSSGICTLRAAIMEANAHPGTDEIKIDKIASGSTADVFKIKINGQDGDTADATKGDFDITESVNLSGQNMVWTVIDGQQADRVFDLHNNAQVSMTSMKIQNGDSKDDNGGGILIRGGSLTLKYIVLDNNRGFVGGGIFNDGGQLSLWRVTLSNNNSGDGFTPGGGVSNNSGGLSIDQSTFNNNFAYRGGGLYNGGQGVVTNSTFSANRANGEGGGIASEGGIATWLDVSNTTVTLNIADDDNSDSGTGGGMYQDGASNFTVRNSIIAQNTDKTSDDDDDCFGTFSSGGYNLIGHNWLCSGFNQTGDQTGGVNSTLDAKLDPLAKNGGYSYTHALQSGSPAIDAGNPNGCKDKYGQTLSYDQRVYQRHIDGDNNGSARCDKGAFEYASHYITPTPNPCTNAAPGAPTLTTPTGGAQVTQKKVDLNWNDVPCATKYKVLVKQDSKKGAKAFAITVGVSYTKTNTLDKGHTYFWKVKACNAAGCKKSAWSSFSIKP